VAVFSESELRFDQPEVVLARLDGGGEDLAFGRLPKMFRVRLRAETIAPVRARFAIVRVTAVPVRTDDTASVELPRSTAAAWSFMSDPASSVALFDTTEAAATLPGVADGVGEIQVFVEASGVGRIASMLEVTESEPDRRAAYRGFLAGTEAEGS
jgi:hypothetical protein